MPARRASHIKLIAFAALLSGTACSRGSAPRESAADSTVPAVASAAETHPAAEMPAVPWTEEEARLQSPDGSVVTLEADYTTGPRTAYVKVDGRTVSADSLVYGLRVQNWWDSPEGMVPGGLVRGGERPGPIALIQVVLGGTGCPAQFRVVELVRRDSVAVTEQFGTCNEAPSAVWFDRAGALWMRFDPYAPHFIRADPEYRDPPPTTWVYRTGGRLREVKSADAAGAAR